MSQPLFLPLSVSRALTRENKRKSSVCIEHVVLYPRQRNRSECKKKNLYQQEKRKMDWRWFVRESSNVCRREFRGKSTYAEYSRQPHRMRILETHSRENWVEIDGKKSLMLFYWSFAALDGSCYRLFYFFLSRLCVPSTLLLIFRKRAMFGIPYQVFNIWRAHVIRCSHFWFAARWRASR